MNLRDLKEITKLANDYDCLSRAMRQAEICYSQPWTCRANGHEISVIAADMDKVFTAMRDKTEQRLRILGVTEFDGEWS